MLIASRNSFAVKPVVFGSVACSNATAGSYLIHYDEFSNITIPSNFTISVWCRTLASPTAGGLFRWGNQAPGTGIGFGFGSTEFNYNKQGTNAVLLAEARYWRNKSTNFSLTSWHHYSVVQSGTTARVYVDGSLFWTQTSFQPYTTPPSNLGFGTGSVSGAGITRTLNCHITRGAMWDEALSDSQILEDYHLKMNSPNNISSLVHFWPMSSDRNYLKDYIGNWNFITLSPIEIVNDMP